MTAPDTTAARRVPRAPHAEARRRFLELSVTVTGYDAATLEGTGMVDPYLATFLQVAGDGPTGQLLERWAAIAAKTADPAERERFVEAQLLPDPTVGPLTSNLAVLWYLGQWNQLPPDWRQAHGARAGDQTRIVSPEAYVQGLVWPAIGTHPQGAKQPGFGSWALPPRRDEP